MRLVPKAAAEAHLGCHVWVYRAGKLGQRDGLVHYRQCFMERPPHRSNVFDPNLHIGLGRTAAVDVRVRFPSGIVREVKQAKARTQVVVEE